MGPHHPFQSIFSTSQLEQSSPISRLCVLSDMQRHALHRDHGVITHSKAAFAAQHLLFHEHSEKVLSEFRLSSQEELFAWRAGIPALSPELQRLQQAEGPVNYSVRLHYTRENLPQSDLDWKGEVHLNALVGLRSLFENSDGNWRTPR